MNRRIAQIALVVSDHHRSCEFYSRVVGPDHIFGTSSFHGETAAKIRGLNNAASTTDWTGWWMTVNVFSWRFSSTKCRFPDPWSQSAVYAM